MENQIMTFLEGVLHGDHAIDGQEEYEFTDVEVKHETEKAWLVPMDASFEKWFPKSRCELTADGTLKIPGWLLSKILEEVKSI